MPVVTPADVHTLPSTTYRASGSTVMAGYSAASGAHASQWVATRRPAINPSEASTNVPEQTEPIRLAFAARCGTQRRTASLAMTARSAASSAPAISKVSMRP